MDATRMLCGWRSRHWLQRKEGTEVVTSGMEEISGSSGQADVFLLGSFSVCIGTDEGLWAGAIRQPGLGSMTEWGLPWGELHQLWFGHPRHLCLGSGLSQRLLATLVIQKWHAMDSARLKQHCVSCL